MASSSVLQELAITAELCGANLTPAAAKALVIEIGTEREDDLLVGLRMMRREHKGRFTLADVLEFSREARKERIAKVKTCCWCPKPAVEGSPYCGPHTEHMRQIEQGRLTKFDVSETVASKVVAKREPA